MPIYVGDQDYVGGRVFPAGTMVVTYPSPLPMLLRKLCVRRDALTEIYRFTVMAFALDEDFARWRMGNINRLIERHNTLGVVVMDGGPKYFERTRVFVDNYAANSIPFRIFAEEQPRHAQRRWQEATDCDVLTDWEDLMSWLIRVTL